MYIWVKRTPPTIKADSEFAHDISFLSPHQHSLFFRLSVPLWSEPARRYHESHGALLLELQRPRVSESLSSRVLVLVTNIGGSTGLSACLPVCQNGSGYDFQFAHGTGLTQPTCKPFLVGNVTKPPTMAPPAPREAPKRAPVIVPRTIVNANKKKSFLRGGRIEKMMSEKR